jgi:hypothetical protein
MANVMDYAALFTAFATLFVVIDPIGLAPVFVALTQGMAPKKRKAIALRACVIAFFILSLFGLLGESVLGFAGISMPAFQIAQNWNFGCEPGIRHAFGCAGGPVYFERPHEFWHCNQLICPHLEPHGDLLWAIHLPALDI